MGRFGIEVAGWLISHEHGWVVGKRSRNGDALLLPTGEFAGQTLGKCTQANHLQAGLRTCTPGASWQPATVAQFQRQQHIFDRCQRRHQLIELEDDADVLPAPASQGVLAVRRSSSPPKRMRPLLGPVDACQQVQQGGFPAARWPINHKQAQSGHAEGDIIEDNDVLRVCGDSARQMFHLDQRLLCRGMRRKRMRGRVLHL